MAVGRPAVFKAERICASNCLVGESPVWDPAGECFYWLDIPGMELFCMRGTGGDLQRYPLPLRVSALALHRDGGFAAATERGFAHLTMSAEGPEFVFGMGPDLPAGWRMNDGACDRQGRFWAGSLSPTPAEQVGALYSLESASAVTARGGQFRVQNGLAWSPDGRRMYVSDSHVSNPHVLRFEFDPETGERRNGVLFADHAGLGGRPDGAAMDVDGCYWIAACDSGRVLRLTPDGRIDAEIHVDVTNPTNICFGGDDLKTAFITSLRPGGAPEGGDVFAVHLPFQGLAEPSYRP